LDKLFNHSFRPANLVLLLQDLSFGGTQRQALELARLLPPERFRVEVWLMAGGRALLPLAREFGLEPVWLSRRQEVGPGSLAHLWRRLRQTPVDLLLPLTVVPNIWGRLLGRLAGVPLIVGNCRGGGAARRQHERWLWPLAHHILCNSAALKETLTGGCGVPAQRVTVINNGVDLNFIRPTPGDDSPEFPVVLSVARLVPDKDPGTLVRAFRLVAQEHLRAQLWLVGEGPLEEPLRRQVRESGLVDRVRFLAGRPDLRPLLKRASLLALTSVVEAMPNVILEAMAAGLPVAATGVGGVPELVAPGQTGWLAPPGDAPALAAAISQLLGSAETRRAFGRAGRRRVEQDFSLAAMVRRYEMVLQRLLTLKTQYD
jgi:glycosyltransferase involved in cell wall biosynthesis